MIVQLDTAASVASCSVGFAPSRCREGALDSPMGKPIIQRILRNAGFMSPILEGHGTAAVCHDPVRAFVAVLLGAANPMNVARLIVAHVVNPVELESRRGATPNIRQEVVEGMPPSITNRDTATTPKVEVSSTSPVTSGLHVCPGSILLRRPAAKGLPVGRSICLSALCPETAATPCIAASQAVSRDSGFVTALAPTAPPARSTCGTLGCRCRLNDQKPPKPFTSQVDTVHTNSIAHWRLQVN